MAHHKRYRLPAGYFLLMCPPPDLQADNNHINAMNRNKPLPISPPMDLSNITLSSDLLLLSEQLAEEAHNVWAYERMRKGWTWGLERNDILRQTPCMLPYAALPEAEKRYDREITTHTLKVICKLGYEIKFKSK